MKFITWIQDHERAFFWVIAIALVVVFVWANWFSSQALPAAPPQPGPSMALSQEGP